MDKKHFIGKRVSSLETYSPVGPITGVALVVDENNEYLAGDDSGYVMEIECPYGTQAMADALLASLAGNTYRGYRADAAELDSEAELGDGVTLDDVYSMLAYRSVGFGPGHMSEIAAPCENELEHEYPYKSQAERQIERKIAVTRSMITKTAEEIRLEVSNELDSLSSSIDVKLDGITLETIGADGKVSSVKLFDTGKIDLTGYATFTGLSGGTTTINGGCIKTGYLTSNRIRLLKDMLWYPSDVPEGKTAEEWFVDANAVGQIGFAKITEDDVLSDGLVYTSTVSNMLVGSNLTTYVIGNKVKINGDFYINGVKPTIISDRRLKHDIDYSLSEKMADLFDELMPVSYRLNVEPDRKRLGFIAQDVLFAGNQSGLSNAAVDIDDNGYYVLHSDELLAVVVAKVKQLESRLEVLEQ